MAAAAVALARRAAATRRQRRPASKRPTTRKARPSKANATRRAARKSTSTAATAAAAQRRLRASLLLRRDVFARDTSTPAACEATTASGGGDEAHLSAAECRLRRRPTMLQLRRRSGDDASSGGSNNNDGATTAALTDTPATTAAATPPPLVAPRAADAPRYTLVLDLDETLVYARDGPLYARAHARDLLHALRDDYEIIVWTAGGREYAKSVLEAINVEHVVAHLVYAHPRWMGDGDGGGDVMYTKDLRLLGRDMRYTVLVDNTPDCLRANPQNGIHVDDFEVHSGRRRGRQRGDGGANASAARAAAHALRDRTLFWLREVLLALARSGDTVPHFLATCPLLSRRVVQCVDGTRFASNHLGPRRRRGNTAGAA